MLSLATLITIILYFGSLLSHSFIDDGRLEVDTAQGVVRGTHVEPNVREFLGIPYAIAGRWEAPKDPPSRSKPFDATSFGDSCIQALDSFWLVFLDLIKAGGTDVPESEDCLNLNIWAPSAWRKQNTAVMIWVYGGGFSTGTSNIPSYYGVNMVRENDDVILVTFNYRLNVFGHPNAPQLDGNGSSQNFDLLDVAAAIKWVYNNIANFGGDPERITIFGESAGAMAVDAYAMMHPDDTIVKGIIQQSGSISGSPLHHRINDQGVNGTSWNELSRRAGCGTEATPLQLACMNNVPAEVLKQHLLESALIFRLARDGKTIPLDVRSQAISGEFLKVPLLHGSNEHEMDIYLVTYQIIKRGFNANPVLTEVCADLQTPARYTCRAAVISQDRIRANVPVWRYYFQGVFPQLSGRSDLRAYHEAEIPFVFGTVPNPTSEMAALSKTMQTAWVAFARDPSHGLTKLGWPQFDPNTDSLVQLGSMADRRGVVLGSSFSRDVVCDSLAVLAEANRLLLLQL